MKLIGYCLEDEHRLLVYEFMPKGSMENHLFRSESFLSFSLINVLKEVKRIKCGSVISFWRCILVLT